MQFVALKDWDRKGENTGIQIEIDMRIDVQEKISLRKWQSPFYESNDIFHLYFLQFLARKVTLEEISPFVCYC